jgi:hypothetical protein
MRLYIYTFVFVFLCSFQKAATSRLVPTNIEHGLVGHRRVVGVSAGLLVVQIRPRRPPLSSTPIQRRPTNKVPRILGRVPPDLRLRGPVEAKSFVRGPTFDPPGTQGRVFDLKSRSCGRDRRCKFTLGCSIVLPYRKSFICGVFGPPAPGPKH